VADVALALNRTGVVFKKCDRTNHKPQSNKACAAGTCQHTCADVERCAHAWTLRYWADGKQRERSFKDVVRSGRTVYGSGRKLAQDAQLKLTVDKRAGDKTFADYASAGKANFGEAAEAFIMRLPVNERSRRGYLSNYRAHVKPAFGGKAIIQVANDRDGVLDLLTVAMRDFSVSVRRIARMIITGTCDEAVKAGKIREHRLGDIELADNGAKHDRTDFVFPAHSQVKFVADGGEETLGAGICVWLMRGCGLRPEEAIGVEKEEFRDGGTLLRLTGQASQDGREKLPLKKRKKGESRDIPVPTWLWDMIEDLPDGPLMPGNGDRKYQLYSTVHGRFMNAAEKAGIPAGFTPHSLRHAFASAMLSKGVPITDVAQWLGHRDVRVTYRIYNHLVPSAAARAIAVLDDEYAEWSKPEKPDGEE
jgi:integrase